jgi:hypothetical protein
VSRIRSGPGSAIAVANSRRGDAIANAVVGDSGPYRAGSKRPRRRRTRHDFLGLANLVVGLLGLLFASATTFASSAGSRLGALAIQDFILTVLVLATLVWLRSRPRGRQFDLIQRLSKPLSRGT